MPRKKRKYTRKNKKNFSFYLIKIFILGIFLLIAHIIFVNGQILFFHTQKSDVILITGDSQQNSKNISSNLQTHIDKSLELFQGDYAKKLLILGEINNFKIDEVELIKDIISENDIWEGNIAYEISSLDNYPKNTQIFLQANDWKSIIYTSPFGEYYKNKYNFSQKISKNNIEISYYNTGFFNSFTGIFKNYYYYWKI